MTEGASQPLIRPFYKGYSLKGIVLGGGASYGLNDHFYDSYKSYSNNIFDLRSTYNRLYYQETSRQQA